MWFSKKEVTPSITLKSYTFFNPLNLSRSNGKKKILINANILIRISLIISHLLYFISISRPKKNVIFEFLSTFLSLFLLLQHCSTSMYRLPAEEGKKKMLKKWILEQLLKEHWMNRTLLSACFLDISELNRVFKFLDDLSHICGLYMLCFSLAKD